MQRYDFAAALERCGGIWKALPPSKFDPSKPHAELTSGRHSDGFVNLSMLLTMPDELSRACGHLVRKAIAEHGATTANPLQADWVVGSAVGGITLAHEIARWLDAKCAFTEKTGPNFMDLKRFVIPEGANVVIVEDVTTTGGTCVKTAFEMRHRHTQMIPLIVTMVNRRKLKTLDVLGDTFAVTSLDLDLTFNDWAPAECPYCTIGSKALRPKDDYNWAQFMTA